MDESPNRGRERSVETRLRAKNIANRLFDEEALVKVDRFVVLERLGMGAAGAVYRAYDPTLDRAIALKVLHPDRLALGSGGEANMRREAKALARLAHPNVVTVHEVGGASDEVWIAMELVDGGSLAAHLPTLGDDRFSAVVDLMLQAGEGLHAAHGAGVVHRDFKPANILVGKDGRLRVADFGLASGAPLQAEADDEAVGLGTPAYMAPEQRDQAVDARADQYAYCVVFWEALFGERPSPEAAPPPTDHGAPRARALLPVLQRGLQPNPADRFESMAALLEAVRGVVFGGVRRTRRRRMLAAGVGIVGLTAASTWALSSSVDAPCTGGAERLENLWPADQRDAALTRLTQRPSPYASEAAPRIRAAVDRFADHWVDAHRQTCLGHARKEQSDRVFERRMACLDQAGASLSAFSEQTAAAELPALVAAAAGLPPPLACTTVQPEPDTVRPSAAQREEVDAIDVLLAQARTHLAAGAPQRALQVTAEALERARALAFGPAIARTLHERGRIVTTVGDLPELSAETAIGDLEEATQRALEARAFPLAIEAWSRQAWLRGTRGGDTKTLLDQSAVLLAMAQGSANASVAQALLYNNLGGLHLVQADHPAARPLFQRAIEITGTLEQPTRELENAPLNLALITEDNDARAALFERVIAERSRALGAEHPQVLEVQLVYATTAASDVAGDVFEALGQRYQRFHPEFSKQRFEVHEEAAWTALASADRPAARRHFAAAAALDETDPLARRVAQGLADLLAGDTKSAGEVLRAVTKETVSTPWQRGPLAHAHLGLALAERDPAQLRAAAALFATLAYLPTAVVARRFAYASATLEDVVPQLAAVRQAVDAWRNGVGSRAELDRALQAASAQPQLSPHTLPTSPTQIESQ